MQTARRWASAKNKRLPPLMKSVLVKIDSAWGASGERVTIGWRVEQKRWIVLTAVGSKAAKVTHWMPFPAPPETSK